MSGLYGGYSAARTQMLWWNSIYSLRVSVIPDADAVVVEQPDSTVSDLLIYDGAWRAAVRAGCTF